MENKERMTKKETQTRLKNSKIQVFDKSSEIQKKLFECGFKWTGGDTKVLYTSKPFLYLYDNLSIGWGDNLSNFISKDTCKEITPEEILSIEIVEESEFKTITDSITELLEYKNSKYGNAVLKPLNIFTNKCKAGQRLDDKLARIKNSETLRKNDIVDLIGYLILTCKENNWTNFDELKD